MVLVNSTKPIRHFHRALWNFGTLALLAVVMVGWPVYGQDLKPVEGEPAEDRLSLAEEELAYSGQESNREGGSILEDCRSKNGRSQKTSQDGVDGRDCFMPSRLLLSTSGGSYGSCLG